MVLGASALGMSSSAWAAKKVVRKAAPRSAHPTARTQYAPTNKKKTVSELLQGIAADNRGKQFNIQKSATMLPEIQRQVRAPTPQAFIEVKPPRSSELFHETGTDEEKLEAVTDQGIQELFKL